MKTKILTLATVAAITLGTAGASTAGVSVATPNLFFEGVETAQTQTVEHRKARAKKIRKLCKKLYYEGFHLRKYHSRWLYLKICQRRSWLYGNKNY